MTRIGGLEGNFHGNLLIEIMNSMKNQNSKSGIFLSSRYSTVYNKECCRSDFGKTYYNLGIGSNYNKDIDSLQPLIDKNLVFIIDGTIYNIDEINEFLNEKNNQIYTKNKENELVFELIKSFYIENNDLLESIKKVIKIIDGDYTFAIFDSENLALVRDSTGIHPLYYYSPLDLTNKFDLDLDNTSNLDMKNDYNLDMKNNYNCFASEKKSFWKMGIDNSKIKTLKPGHILYNWKEIIPRETSLNSFEESLIKEDNYDKIKQHLKTKIEKSVLKRISNIENGNIGMIFSGGVDSSVLLIIIKNFLENKRQLKEKFKNFNVNLYSVGVKNSKDLKYSKKMAKELDFPIKTKIIKESTVRNNLKLILEIIEENNIIKIGVGMTLHLAIKLAIEDNIDLTNKNNINLNNENNIDLNNNDNINLNNENNTNLTNKYKTKVVLTGLGADELFGGYHRYLNTLKNGGISGVQKELENDIKICYDVNLERDNKIANFNGVDLKIPYLDKNIIDFSLKIPIKYKINSPEDNLRKNILRDIAIDLGVCEEIALRPKKAAQYGSGIDKILRKKVLKKVDIDNMMEDIINKYSNSIN